jgi:transposase InsO family protein
MPWKETSALDERVKLIGDYLEEQWSITQLGQIYGISRKTIYKWIGRYHDQGIDGIKDRSRAPRSHPNATRIDIVEMIVKEKLNHQHWGPKKVIASLETQSPETPWPAISTVGEILKCQGLVKPRHLRHHTPKYSEPFLSCQGPNSVWSADFKGQFLMGDKRMCYPLTLTDNYSRYLLVCRGLRRTTTEVTQPWLEWAFREYGLPQAIRTDNGSPFASVALGGLSQLAVWLIKLGIRPERIESGHPEQNGRHERMHRTLKEETIKPPQKDLLRQQHAFDRFAQEYNYQRPHEALGQKTPASVYEPSSVSYPIKLPDVEYASHITVRQVRHNGDIKWKGKMIYVSQTLAGEPVGLLQVGEDLWQINFCFHHLGTLNERTMKIIPIKGNV